MAYGYRQSDAETAVVLLVHCAGLFSYFSFSLVVCVGLLTYGLTEALWFEEGDETASVAHGGIWNIGLGAPTVPQPPDDNRVGRRLMPAIRRGSALIANTLQLIFTLLYSLSNGILTNMSLAREWNTFSLEPRGLRVSSAPEGQQRTSHFLSLPYQYAVPLMTLSALLHWLISQSIFPVNVQAYDTSMQRSPSGDLITLGRSPRGITASVCVGALLPAALVPTSLRNFKTGMPLAGSCSLAIAAVCHPTLVTEGDRDSGGGEEPEIQYKALMWGVREGVLDPMERQMRM